MISRLFEILSRRIDGPLMVALVLTVSLGLTVVYSASGGGSLDRVIGQGRTTATIAWDTNLFSTSRVDFGRTPAYGETTGTDAAPGATLG